jgi:guanylate kinase
MEIGTLTVFTGASGAGKDSVMDEFLKNISIQKLNLEKVVTCTDRPPRPGEIDGVHYHFLTESKLQEMSKTGKLVEQITLTGTSNKATPKSEIERLLGGENLVWRIDPSRAAEVASGGFFKRLFPENADIMQKHTLVLFITAPRTVIDDRRKRRDLDKYNPEEYRARDEQERPFLEILERMALPIGNLDGKLDKAVDLAVKSVITFNNEIKK